MTSRLRIVICMPDDPSIKARIVRSAVSAGGQVESWVSKETVTGTVQLTLVCGVDEDHLLHEIVRKIDDIERVAVLGVGVFQRDHEASVK